MWGLILKIFHTLLKINFNEVDYFVDTPWVNNSRVLIMGYNKKGEKIEIVSHNKNNVWD